MSTLQDTIYPRLKAVVASQDLERLYTPTAEECELAADATQDETAYLGFLIYLKTFQRLGYFVRLPSVPECIVKHIALHLDRINHIPQLAAYDRSGASRRHQSRIRAYRGVKPFRKGGLQVLQQAIAAAAIQIEDLDDLINVAIEELIRQWYELPGFTTLLKEAQRQRTRTYAAFYQQVMAVLTPERQTLLNELFVVDPLTQRSSWDRLKDPTGKPTLSNLTAIAEHLEWFAPYQSFIDIVTAFPDAKRNHFASEALVYDRATMLDIKAPRRYALICALMYSQYAGTLDDVAEMYIKRIRAIQNDARKALEAYHREHRARTDTLVTALRDVVVGYHQEASLEERFAAIDAVLKGKSATLLQDCEAHLTYAGNNYAPFMWKFYRSHRATVFRLLKLLPLRPGSQNTLIRDALAFLLKHERTKSAWIDVRKDDELLLDLSWIPVGWWRLVTDLQTREEMPKSINRRHFEACLVVQILNALNNGDLYVEGADTFGDPFPRLCSWEEYHLRIADYGAQLGFSVAPDTFVADQQRWLARIATTTDCAFPENDKVTLVDGRPVIRRPKRAQDPPGLSDLRRQLDVRRPARGILDVLADTSYWLNWTSFFGPLSGLESKLDDTLERYLATVFCYGCQLGPSATARALGTYDRRQLTRIDQYHISEEKLDQAIQCFVNAYQRCALPRFWGSPEHASIDGTKWEIYEQNLLSEQHIRYGGYGAIALYLLSGTYIALMANFIACSAWEGHYLLDLLEQNQSDIQLKVIHSDTQGQNEAIFGMAFLRGIEMMPRIRDWRDLIFYRPYNGATYKHIDGVFSDKVIDWELIRTHLPDMLRIALSIKEGRVAPSVILRTISGGRSKLAQAYRELGRVRRTGFLLRIMAEAELRALVHRETNKSESFNRFVKWLGFGSAGVIRENERAAQRKAIKYTVLVANAMMFYNTVTMADDLRALIREGYRVDAACVAALSPYSTKNLERFGKYTLNVTNIPDAVDYETPVVSPDNAASADGPSTVADEPPGIGV